MKIFIYYYFPEFSSEIRMVSENFEKEHNDNSKKLLRKKRKVSQTSDYLTLPTEEIYSKVFMFLFPFFKLKSS